MSRPKETFATEWSRDWEATAEFESAWCVPNFHKFGQICTDGDTDFDLIAPKRPFSSWKFKNIYHTSTKIEVFFFKNYILKLVEHSILRQNFNLPIYLLQNINASK